MILVIIFHTLNIYKTFKKIGQKFFQIIPCLSRRYCYKNSFDQYIYNMFWTGKMDRFINMSLKKRRTRLAPCLSRRYCYKKKSGYFVAITSSKSWLKKYNVNKRFTFPTLKCLVSWPNQRRYLVSLAAVKVLPRAGKPTYHNH